MSRMFLGASNLERMEEFLAFRTGFNVQLNENTLLLDVRTLNHVQSLRFLIKTIIKDFQGRRVREGDVGYILRTAH